MELPITVPGKPDKSRTIIVSPAIFGCEYREGLVHQVLTAYRINGRAGCKANKSRAAVSGGGAKPWRQKGTGRARAGTTRGPLWRSGSVTFAAQPRDYKKKINKKVYRLAMRIILSELVRENRLIVVENFSVSEPKTSMALAQFDLLSLSSALVVMDTVPDSIYLSIRNLQHFSVSDVKALNPVILVGSQALLMTMPAIRMVETWLDVKGGEK